MGQDLIGKLGAIAVMAIAAWLIYISYVASPQESVEGKKLVPTKTTPVFIEKHNDIDHTITITHLPTGDTTTVFSSSGELYRDPPHLTPGDDKFKITVVRKVSVISQEWDIGTYAGYLMGPPVGEEGSRIDVGIRVSPCRLFDLVAPDLLFGRQAAGVGLSFYPPPEVFGHVFQHIGMGCGYVWSFDTGAGRVMPYASFSVTF